MSKRGFPPAALAPATLALALVGAMALSSTPAVAADKEKCYGVAKSGENGCAHAKGHHSCAGNTTMNYDGGDWKLVDAGTCESMGGAKTAFEGMNPKIKM